MKRVVNFTLPSELAAEPLIYTLGMQFNVVTTILQAHINEDTGWMMLEMEGEEEDIEQGIDWATGKGVKVEPVEDSEETNLLPPPLEQL